MQDTTPAGAAEVIRRLGLVPHPEGGHYVETWRDAAPPGGRGHGTAICFLLAAGERPRWHRVDATEIWHWYAGAPLALATSDGAAPATTVILGPAVERGERPQFVVAPNTWQSARSRRAWTLVGCTVSPAFEYAGFTLAPEGFLDTSPAT